MRERLIFAFYMILMGVLHASYITVQYPNDPARQETIKTFETGNTTYISSTDMVRSLNAGIFTNNARGKIVIYFGGHRIKISAYSSFVVIDDQVYQMPFHSLSDGIDIYVPMRAFIGVLNRHAAPGVSYDADLNNIVVELITHNINGLNIKEAPIAEPTAVALHAVELGEKATFKDIKDIKSIIYV